MPSRGDPLLGLRLSLPPEPGTVRGRAVRRRVWGLCAALLGVVMLLVGAAGLAIVPSLIEDEKALTVTLWRDYATGVRQGKVVQETADTLEGEPIFVCALALAVICGGAYGLYAGVTTLTRARRHAVRDLPATLVTRGKEAAGAALCALPAMVVGTFTSVPVMMAVWLGLLPLVRWIVQRQQQRGIGRHARPPVHTA